MERSRDRSFSQTTNIFRAKDPPPPPPPCQLGGKEKKKTRKIESYRRQPTIMERATSYEAGARKDHFVPPVNPRELAFLFHYHYFGGIT